MLEVILKLLLIAGTLLGGLFVYCAFKIANAEDKDEGEEDE